MATHKVLPIYNILFMVHNLIKMPPRKTHTAVVNLRTDGKTAHISPVPPD